MRQMRCAGAVAAEEEEDLHYSGAEEKAEGAAWRAGEEEAAMGVRFSLFLPPHCYRRRSS